MSFGGLFSAWPPGLAWLWWIWLASSIAVTIWVVQQRGSPVSTLGWIMLLNVLPVVGLVIYAYFGPQRIKRRRLTDWHRRAALMSQRDLQTLLAHRPEPPLWALQHSQLIKASCGLPLCSAHGVRLLASGSATFDALLHEIAAARSHVHLEYYIFEPDTTGRAILDALVERARAGVAVRVLVDAFGSSRLLARRQRPLLGALEAAGGEIAVFHRARRDRLRPLANLRTHRKIAIIDGRVGLLGGINVADEQNDSVRPGAAFRDTHLLLRGSAVRWLQYVFLQDWFYASGHQPAQDSTILPATEPVGDVPVQIVASGPDSDGEAIHRAVIDALGLAHERIWLSTPYFVPTESALNALTNAALRGVQVRLIVPEESDSRIVSAAAHTYYPELLAAGARLYEYRGRMFHPKTLVVDSNYSMIGSANFDNRSFRLNFEIAAVVFDRDLNRQLAALFEADLANSRPASGEREVPFGPRLVESVARLASPLL